MTDNIVVSVIIPARNEEHFLIHTIESVKKQKCKFEYEIIVVDNGSIDDTANIAKREGVIVVSEPVAGLPRAREAGRKKARGKFLVYIDADTTMPTHYLQTVRDAFEKSDRIVAVSNPFRLSDGTRMQRLMIFNYFHVIYPLQVLLMWMMGRSRQVIGGSFAVRSDALEAVGGFNTDIEFYGEDTEVSKRLGKSGVISFLYDVYVSTSARRYNVNGTFRTSSAYVKNYFAVMFFNRPANSDFWRSTLKVLLGLTILLIIRRLWIEFTVTSRVKHFRHILTTNHTHLLILSIILLVIILIGLYGLISPKSSLFGPIVNRMNTTEKLVALSFDDGPTKQATQKVLDILDDHKVKATFFFIGDRLKKEVDIARAVEGGGHDIAHHAYHHTYSLPFRTKRIIRADIVATERVAKEVLGKKSIDKLYRPPHGWRTPWMLQAVRESGYKPIFWDVMTFDYRESTSSDYIANHIIKRTKPGSIIVLHDGIAEIAEAKRTNMLKALPTIISELQKDGYRFVLLKDLV